jgi:sugar phosphate permease
MHHKQTAGNLRFIVLSAVILPYILVYFHRVAPAVVVDPIMKDSGIDASTVGLLSSLYFLVYTFLQVPAGIFADWPGPRITISAGTAIAAFGSLLSGFAPSIEWAFIGRCWSGCFVYLRPCTASAHKLV